MSTYCLGCKKHTEDVNPVLVTMNRGKRVSSQCSQCGKRKSRIVAGDGPAKPRKKGKGFLDFLF